MSGPVRACVLSVVEIWEKVIHVHAFGLSAKHTWRGGDPKGGPRHTERGGGGPLGGQSITGSWHSGGWHCAWHCGEFRGTVSTRQSVRSVRCYFTVPPRPALTPPPALRPAPVNQLVFQPVGQSVIARSLPVLTPPPAQASKQISRHAGLRARPLVASSRACRL